MKKARPFLFVILALLTGWAAGSFTSNHFYDKWIQRYLAHNALVGVSDRLATLNTLRAGDTNQAAELLESQMDGQIMILGAIIQDVPVANRPAADIQLLTRLRDYRMAYPRKTNRPEIDQRIAGVLSLTNTPNQLKYKTQ